ncbi:MAG: hypothetical protein OXG35_11410 [Acidobacteria bacterium]|nr:hypothetical protein [Acidobacteriota bacterium]
MDITMALCAVVTAAPTSWLALLVSGTGCICLGWSWSRHARKNRDWSQTPAFAGTFAAAMAAVISVWYLNQLAGCDLSAQFATATGIAAGGLVLYVISAFVQD